MSLPKHPLVLVKWNDAFSPQATEVIAGSDAAQLNKDLHILTVGWLLNDDPVRGLVVACEWCGGDDYRGATVVPRAMVIEVTPVGKKKSGKPKVKLAAQPIPAIVA